MRKSIIPKLLNDATSITSDEQCPYQTCLISGESTKNSQSIN
ncbi:hypothetical protein UUU_33450 [Klebsiella pneumoniae subsp. pneumoniae DSM 30104 = JCM 1662 = NBRC 14940]|nr:hypothetical protein UUU_33450 [Klebsiella pneumoniae subsp. pneumoniae DSM 30104 = JCM 1662 = NBRC 14940]